MKPKNSLVLAAVAAATFISCNTSPSSYTIEGIVTDSVLNGHMIYLIDMASNDAIDSKIITDNQFSFTGQVDTPFVGILQVLPYRSNVIVEPGSIKAEFGPTSKVSGTSLNDELARFLIDIDTLNSILKTKQQKISDLQNDSTLQIDSIRRLYNSIQNDIDHLSSRYFDHNRDNAVGAFVLHCWSQFLPSARIDSVINLAGENIKRASLIKPIIDNLNEWRKTAPGAMFTDFTIVQPDSTKISLSDYVGKGKYVLVDFWASWCGPCRQEMPHIKEIYEKYHNQGLDILGVAVWDKPGNTRQAIEELNIPWPQILDAQQIPTDLYNIEGIPHLILFAPDGTIVARDLRGKQLKAKVEEVMQSPVENNINIVEDK